MNLEIAVADNSFATRAVLYLCTHAYTSATIYVNEELLALTLAPLSNEAAARDRVLFRGKRVCACACAKIKMCESPVQASHSKMERRKRLSFGAALWLLSLLIADIAECQDDLGYYSPNEEYDNCTETRTCADELSEDLLCRCDSNCTLYGDCCEAHVQSLESTGVDVTSRLDGLLECRSIHLDQELTWPDWGESFWMVSACPAGWLDGRDDQFLLDISNNCSRGSDDLPPVTDLETGMVYKNEYCAVCHQVRHFRQWGYTFECSPELRRLASEPGFQFTLDVVQRWCLACQFRDPHETNNSIPAARPCVHHLLTTDDCLEREILIKVTQVQISEEQYEQIVSQCQSGPYNPVAQERRINSFRNQYCALCNGIRVSTEELTCVNPYQNLRVLNFCQLEAFNIPVTEAATTEAPTTEAPTTEIPTTEAPTTETPATKPLTEFPIILPSFPPERPLGTAVPTAAGIIVVETEAAAPLPVPFTVFVDPNRNTQTIMTETTTISVTTTCEDGEVFDHINRKCRETACPEVARGEPCILSHINTNINRINVINTNINSINVTLNDSFSCDEGFPVPLNDSEFTLLGNETLEFGGEVFEIVGYINSSAVICVTLNDSFSCDEGVPVSLNDSVFTLLGNETLEFGGEMFEIVGYINSLAVICVTLNNSFSCDEGFPVKLNDSEFTPIDNEMLKFGGESFEIVGYINGSPVICLNGTIEVNVTTFSYSYPVAITILTYVGCSLSIIGCGIVLLTYTLFKELRTLPGKILMNLCAAILATSFSLVAGIPLVALSEEEALCHTAAILLHWLVLSEFTWMTVMSYELARTLIRASHLRQTETAEVKRKIFLIYLLIGWGIPTAITGVTVILNYTTDYIQYGEDGFCWIGDSNSLYIVLLAPVALSLLLNGVAFFITTYLLIMAQRGEAKLQKQQSTSYLRIHASVFSVTGLTWIFGIVAILARNDWAWYVFIVLTSTQGFSICAAFLFTRKVFSLYKERFWSKVSSRFSFKSSSKQSTQDSSVAVRYVRKGENVSTVSTTSVKKTDLGPAVSPPESNGQEKQEPVRYARRQEQDEEREVEKGPASVAPERQQSKQEPVRYTKKQDEEQ